MGATPVFMEFTDKWKFTRISNKGASCAEGAQRKGPWESWRFHEEGSDWVVMEDKTNQPGADSDERHAILWRVWESVAHSKDWHSIQEGWSVGGRYTGMSGGQCRWKYREILETSQGCRLDFRFYSKGSWGTLKNFCWMVTWSGTVSLPIKQSYLEGSALPGGHTCPWKKKVPESWDLSFFPH